MLQQEFQGRLPPGELQLSGNNLGRNLTCVQVIEQLRQAALTQLLGQSVTLRQGHQQHAVRHEGVQARVQRVQVGAHKIGALNGVSQDNTQAGQLRNQRVQGGSQLIQVLRDLRGAGRLNVANPLGTLRLNHLQLLVQVTNIHAGQDVFLRRAAQAGTLHTAHLDAVLTTPRARSSRRNQVGHRAVVDVRAETLERLTDAHQNRQLRLPLGDGTTRAQTQHCAGAVHRLAQVQQGGLEGNDQGVRLGGFLVIDQAGTVPRGGTRCRRKTINLTQAHQLGTHLLTLHERIKHGAVKTHAGCRAVLGGGQFSQTLQRRVDRNLPVGVLVQQGTSVVEQRGTGRHKLFVQVLRVRLFGALITHDCANELGALSLSIVLGKQVVAQALNTGALEQRREFSEGGALLAHHEHGFTATHQGGCNIHGGTQRLGAGRRSDGEGESADRGVDNFLGVRIRVQQEHFLCRVTLVQGRLQVVGVELARLHAGHLQRRQVTNQRGDGGVRQFAQAFLQVSKGRDEVLRLDGHARNTAC